jgi:hypothetical protein
MKKILFFTFFLAVTFSAYSQGNSSQHLISEISESDLGLDNAQLAKLNRLRNKSQYKSVKPIRIGNIASLQQRGGVLPIKVPGVNKPYLFKASRIEAEDDNNFIWEGKLPNEEGIVTIYSKNNSFFGFIEIGVKMYEIKDLGEKQNVLIEIDESTFPDWKCGLTVSSLIPQDFDRKNEGGNRSHCHVVSVLVLFTPEADASGNPQNQAVLGIDQTNNALRNSGIDANTLTFVLAGVEELPDFNQTDNIGDDWNALIDDDDAQDARAMSNADIVVLFTDADYNSNQTFGVAATNVGSSEDAYSIVEIDAPGGRFTFPHESAHLFGCLHSIDDTPQGTFNHGHIFNTGSTTRRTILATAGAGQVRIQNYSNPGIQFLGVATGVVGVSDNGMQLENEVSTVSSYVTGCLELQVTMDGPTNLLNNQSGTWDLDISNCNQATNIQWAKSSNGLQYTNFSGGTSATTSSITNSNMYLRASVTCDDGQTDIAYYLVLNGDATSCDPCLSTWEEKKEGQIGEISIYPNPAIDDIIIGVDILEDGIYRIYLMNGYGQEEDQLFDGYIEAGRYQYSITSSDKKEGIKYIIVAGEKAIKSKKLIVF